MKAATEPRTAEPVVAASRLPFARLAAPLAVLAACVLLVCAPWLLSVFWLGLVTQALIFSLFAASLDLLLGYTGLPSLGHAAFFGLAGYGLGVGTVKLDLDPLVAAGLGIGIAVVVAALFGLIAVRSRGIYFLVLTLALGQVLWGMAVKWTAVTGGYNGLPGVGRVGGLDGIVGFYLFVVGVVLVSLALLYLVIRSPLGLTFQGIRESETRMRQLGYRTAAYQWLAFVLAAFFAGVAGVLSASYNQFVSPDALYWTMSALVLLMVILGSVGTFWGPVVAGGALIIAEHMISDATDRWPLVLGVLYIVIVLVAPAGLLRALRRALGRRGSPTQGGAR